MEVIDGERAGTHLYHNSDGYFYHLNKGREYDNGHMEMFLRCKNWYSRQCRGGAKISSDGLGVLWTNLSPHTCPRDRDFQHVHQLRREILEASVDLEGPFETPAQVVNRVRERFPVDIAAQITPARMRNSIGRARAALYPPVPATLLDLGNLLNENLHLSATLEGHDSTFSGTVLGPGTVSLVFISNRMKRYLARTKIVSCDGTFGSRPANPRSSQVLQIVGIVDHHVVPLATVLMTGKTQAEYVLVLRYLRQLVPRFRPTLVLTDFEIGLQNAWREVFQCQVVGCYWHFCRAVTIMARQLGLTALLRDHRVARSIVRALLAIPLLPEDIMARGLQVLITEATRRGFLDVLHPIFDYFVETWFSPAYFSSLSVFHMKHRTNNCAESANRMLRAKTGIYKPSVWHYLSAIRKYEREAFVAQRTLDAAIPLNRPRRVQAINNDARIKAYTRQLFQQRISIRTFLHRASTRVLNVFDLFLQPAHPADRE